MNHRIRLILFLVGYLAIVFNLDKLGHQAGFNLSLSPIFFIAFTAAIFITIAAASLIKFPLSRYLIVSIAIYVAGRWALYPTAAFWTEMNIYQAVTEIVLLGGGVAGAYHLVTQIKQVEDDLGKIITLPATMRQVRSFESALEDVKVEFVRSRRYNHPLSMLVIEPTRANLKEDLDRIFRENQKKISRRYLATQLAETIINQIRRTDMIMTKDWDGRFIILCPENNANGASVLAKRIQADAKTHLDISIQYGIAAFPSDALTLDDLIRRAEMNMAAAEQISFLSGAAWDMPQATPSSDQQKDDSIDRNTPSEGKMAVFTKPSTEDPSEN